MTKYELPGFHIPKQGMHWAMKGLCLVGGLIFLQVIAVGVFAWKRHGENTLAAARVSGASPVAAQVVPPPGGGAVTPALAGANIALTATKDKGGSPEPAVAAAPEKSRSHDKHHAAGGHGAGRSDRKKLLANAGGKSPKVARATPKKADAIDDILKNFK